MNAAKSLEEVLTVGIIKCRGKKKANSEKSSWNLAEYLLLIGQSCVKKKKLNM